MSNLKELKTQLYGKLKDDGIEKEYIDKSVENMLKIMGSKTFSILEECLENRTELKKTLDEYIDYNMAKKINSDNRFEPIHTQFVGIRPITGENQSVQMDRFVQLLNGLNVDVVKKQAEQILNYTDNEVRGDRPVAAMYASCSMLIKDYLDNLEEIKKEIKISEGEEFKKSLDISQDCIMNTYLYRDYISKLKDNDSKSFILMPVHSSKHVFSIAIYKKGDKYELVTINKGERDYTADNNEGKTMHHTFEKYIVSKDKMGTFLEFVQRAYIGERMQQSGVEISGGVSTAEFYKKLIEISDDGKSIEMTDIMAKEQIVGNCYYKEVEEGLKYVYSNAFNKYEKISYKSAFTNEDKKINIPKLPTPTEEFHKKLLNVIKENYKDASVGKYIDELIVKYDKNKKFRQAMEENRWLSLEEKEKKFFEIFGENIPNNEGEKSEYLKKCFRNVDIKTLQENRQVIVKILKDNHIKVPKIMYEDIENTITANFKASSLNYLRRTDNYNELNFLKEYFPEIGGYIKKQIDRDIFNDLCNEISNNYNNYNKIVSIVNEGLTLDVSPTGKAYLYRVLSKKEWEQNNREKAITLMKKAYEVAKGNVFQNEEEMYIKEYNEMVNRTNELEFFNKTGKKEKEYQNDYISNLGQENIPNNLVLRKMSAIDREKGKEDYEESFESMQDKEQTYEEIHDEIVKKEIEIIEHEKTLDEGVYDDKLIKLLFSIASLYEKTRRYQDAVEAYKEILDKEYNYDAIAKMTKIYKSVGNYTEPIYEIEKQLGKLQNSIDKKCEMELKMLEFECCVESDRKDLADRAFFIGTAIISMGSSKEMEIYSKLVNFYEKIGDYVKAAYIYEHLLNTVFPNNSDIINKIGRLTGKVEKAGLKAKEKELESNNKFMSMEEMIKQRRNEIMNKAKDKINKSQENIEKSDKLQSNNWIEERLKQKIQMIVNKGNEKNNEENKKVQIEELNREKEMQGKDEFIENKQEIAKYSEEKKVQKDFEVIEESMEKVDGEQVKEENLEDFKTKTKVDKEKMQYLEERVEFEKYINILGKDAINNQVLQILNYERNTGASGQLPLYTIFENCRIVLKESIKEKNTLFEESLNNSKECLLEPLKYQEKIEGLKNDKSSFIIAPIKVDGHRFSIAIYKNKNEEYECVVINKGDRNEEDSNGNIVEHHIFEKYIIPKNNIKNIIDFVICEKVKNDEKSTSYVYNKLRSESKNGRYERLENIIAKEQSTGNCYYKELEEGLKYVYSKAFIPQFSNIEMTKNSTITPKFPINTKEFNSKVLKNIAESYHNDEVRKFIEDTIKIYEKNKDFRNEIKEHEFFDFENKKKIMYGIFGDGAKIKDLEDIKECLKYVDSKTYIGNISFFTEILKQNGIFIPQEIMMIKDSKNPLEIQDYLESKATDIPFIKEYFPYVLDTMNIHEIYDKEVKKLKLNFASMKSKKNISKKECIKLRNQVIKTMKLDLDYGQRMDLLLILADLSQYTGNMRRARTIYRRTSELSKNIGNFEMNDILKEQMKTMETMENVDMNADINTGVDENLKVISSKNLKLMDKRLDELIERGDNTVAIYQCNVILKEDPTNVPVKKKRLELLLSEGEIKEALMQCKDILNTRPNDIEVMREKARILGRLNMQRELMDTYDDILRIKPNDFKANMGKIYLLRQNGMQKEAIKIIENQLKEAEGKMGLIGFVKNQKRYLHKDRANNYNFYKKVKLNCLIDLGKNKEVMELCYDILNTSKEASKKIDYNVIVTMAETMCRVGRFKEALHEYEKIKPYSNDENEIVNIMQEISKQMTKVKMSIGDLKNVDIHTLSVQQLNCLDERQVSNLTKEQVQRLSKNQLENLSNDIVGVIMKKMTPSQLLCLRSDSIKENTKQIKMLSHDQYKALEDNNKLEVLSMKARISMKIDYVKNIKSNVEKDYEKENTRKEEKHKKKNILSHDKKENLQISRE